MNPVRVIERKRDGHENTREELEFIVRAATNPNAGLMSEAQLAAWCMAVVWRGMSAAETAALTLAMAQSGDRVDLTGLPKPWVDKHSTGGVGDKTTLVLLPMLAACGLTCVKMSGRGLGKTGGTIDKLESIPGFQTALSIDALVAQANQIGLALTGQTPNLTPADGTLYALRDVTGTVKSIPLIASSVLSKKIAGGAEVISIDLKCGSGAFMQTHQEARALGECMLGIARELDLRLGIEITDMDQPLGCAVGNLIEVQEAIETLAGGGPPRFRELVIELCESMLATAQVQGGKAAACLDDGTAYKKAEEWIKAQGATITLAEVAKLPLAPIRKEIRAQQTGWIQRIDAGIVGEVVVDLGGGRRSKGDTIHPGVGVRVQKVVGETVTAGEILFEVYAAQDPSEAIQQLSTAVAYSETQVAPNPVVIERLA